MLELSGKKTKVNKLSSDKYIPHLFSFFMINVLMMIIGVLTSNFFSPKIDASILLLFYIGVFFICVASIFSSIFLLKAFFLKGTSEKLQKRQMYYLQQAQYCIALSGVNFVIILTLSLFNWVG